MHPLTVGTASHCNNSRPIHNIGTSFDYSKFLGCNNNTKEWTGVTDNSSEQNSCIDPVKIIGGILVALGFAGFTTQAAQALSDTSKNKSNK